MKLFIVEHNSIFKDIKKFYNVVDKIEDADKVLLWTDVTSFERGLIAYAKKLGKETIVFQHGRRGTSRYYPPFNEKIQADKLLVWGEEDRKALIEAGQDPKKIKVVGTTVFRHLIPRKEHNGINVVFCPEHWDEEIMENLDVRNALHKFAGDRNNVKIITKVIEGHRPGFYDNEVRSNRREDDHLKICAEVLSTADVVVGISESTFELLAQALNIPVVIMSDWKPKPFAGDKRYLKYRRIISKGSKKSSLKNLEKTLEFTIENPDELEEERYFTIRGEGGIHLDTLQLMKDEINA